MKNPFLKQNARPNHELSTPGSFPAVLLAAGFALLLAYSGPGSSADGATPQRAAAGPGKDNGRTAGLKANDGHDSGAGSAAAKPESASVVIALLEKSVAGQSKAGLPLTVRVDALETLVFGQPSAGGLNDRIQRLNSYLHGGGRKPSASGLLASAAAGGKKIAPPLPDSALPQKTKRSPGKSGSGQAKSSSTMSERAASSEPAPQDSRSSATAGQESSLAGVGSSKVEAGQTQYPAQLQKLMVDAVTLFHDGHINEAKSAFESIYAKYPDCVDACYNLGSLAERNGEDEAALIYYMHAQKLAPGDEQISQAVGRMKSSKNAVAPGTFGNPAADPLQNSTALANSPAGLQNSGSTLAASSASGLNPQPAIANSSFPKVHSQNYYNAMTTGKTLLRFGFRAAIFSMRFF